MHFFYIANTLYLVNKGFVNISIGVRIFLMTGCTQDFKPAVYFVLNNVLNIKQSKETLF